MKITFYLAFFYLLILPAVLHSQHLEIFDLRSYRKNQNEDVAFISLSERYRGNDHPDSIAIPYIEVRDSVKYIKLEAGYRRRFLSGTNISESDKVFIYDYYHNILASFTVKNLDVVACHDLYSSDNEYSYMIGFVIVEKIIKDFGIVYPHTFIYVGKENVFAPGNLKQIIWEKIEPKNFPSRPISTDTATWNRYVSNNPYKTGDTYKYEAAGLQYFVQDFVRLKDNWLFAKRLLVIDRVTKEAVYETIYFEGESARFVHSYNQWTGKLFKNKPSVVFGFQSHAFGCPLISFLDPAEPPIYIKCDNRH